MFPIFSCSINVTVTLQSDVPSFHMNQTALAGHTVAQLEVFFSSDYL